MKTLERLPAPSMADPGRGLQSLERLAWLLDRAVRIPGTRIRLGLDSLLGLLPVAGDTATGLIQAALIVFMQRRFQIPRRLAARMAANVLLDMVVGSIPLLGDLFDVSFKASTRNVELLRRHLADRQGT